MPAVRVDIETRLFLTRHACSGIYKTRITIKQMYGISCTEFVDSVKMRSIEGVFFLDENFI